MGNLHTIHSRQHHVEQHKIELCILCEREGRDAVMGKAHDMALFFEAAPEHLRHSLFVFDNQDLHLTKLYSEACLLSVFHDL